MGLRNLDKIKYPDVQYTKIYFKLANCFCTRASIRFIFCFMQVSRKKLNPTLNYIAYGYLGLYFALLLPIFPRSLIQLCLHPGNGNISCRSWSIRHWHVA